MLKHNVRRAHILGFSDGGNIALKFALKYPEFIDRLVLNGANLYPKGVKFRYQFPVELGYYISRLFSETSVAAKLKMELLGLMVNDPYIDYGELKNIKHKTLVIAGTRDIIRESHTKLIANSIPDSELIFIKGDHFIANKKADEFNSAVERFLKD